MANAEGMPLKMVLDNACDTMNVTITPRNTENISQTVVAPAPATDEIPDLKNIEDTRIIAGNLPLH